MKLIKTKKKYIFTSWEDLLPFVEFRLRFPHFQWNEVVGIFHVMVPKVLIETKKPGFQIFTYLLTYLIYILCWISSFKLPFSCQLFHMIPQQAYSNFTRIYYNIFKNWSLEIEVFINFFSNCFQISKNSQTAMFNLVFHCLKCITKVARHCIR